MTFSLFIRSTLFFVGLFVAGSALCLPLFQMRLRALLSSRLWTKIIWWWPIYAGFMAVLWGGMWVGALVAAGVIAQGWREGRRYFRPLRNGALAYFILVAAAMAHVPAVFVGLGNRAVPVLVTICFCSALSDVAAFFLGSFVGRHHLPAWINPGKSWEGVLGQVLGSLLGYELVVLVLGLSLGWGLALTIGLASAAGDLINSIVKRRLGIKDWGQSLPGHGGFLDRFSSLSVAVAAGFWLMYAMN